MKLIIFILALLLAILNSHSENMDSADADYCIDWIGDEKSIEARLIFVKKYKDLKIRLNIQEPLKCMGRYTSWPSSDFYFIDESGRKVFIFETLGFGSSAWESKSAHSTVIRIDGRNDDSSRSRIGRMVPELVKILQPEIQIKFPDTTESNKYEREKLLQLKGKIIDAYINNYIKCDPDLDTTYRINFRVRITGVCKEVKYE
jgi:hypothetical protein